MTDGVKYEQLATEILGTQDLMRSEWEWLAKRILPRTEDVLRGIESPDGEFKREHSSKACEALHTLVGAFMTHVTPSGQKWFDFEDKSIKKSELHKFWYRNATDVTLDALAESNFYGVIQEAHMDRALFGTSCILCEGLRDGGLMFKHIPVGTYGIAEDKDGNVNVVCRKFKYTAHQAMQAWGKKKLPTDVLNDYEDERKRYTVEREYWHLVVPRKTYTVGNGNALVNPKKMKFASVYIYGEGHHEVVDEGGYPEFPYLVSRFLKWNGVWGYPPARKCKDDLESIVRLERLLDKAGEVAVYPRVFIDAEQDGDVDFRAGGQTVIDRNIAGLNLPREWGQNVRIEWALERIEQLQKNVESAFYVPFLQVVTNVDRQMTATEVVARQKEQVIGISPTFSQFVYDFNKFLARIFAELYRQGAFNRIKGTQPSELRVYAPDGVDFSVDLPGVRYKGAISQSVEMAQRQSMDYAMQTAATYVQMTGDATVMDCIDMKKAVKFLFEVSATPTEMFRTDGEVEQLQAQREQEAMAQQQLAQAQAMNQQSQALRNISQ